jgi:hypothetical protein
MSTLGVPNLEKIFFYNKVTTVFASSLAQGIASTHYET